MVILSETVIDVLNRIYLEGIAKEGKAPDIYFKSKEALLKLDKRVVTQYSKTFPHCPQNWQRYNYPILKIGNLYFSYEDIFEEETRIVRVWEIAYNDKILTENQFSNYSLIDKIWEQYYQCWRKLIY